MFEKKDTLTLKGIGVLLLLFHHLYLKDTRIIKYSLQSLLSTSQVVTIGQYARICVWIFVLATSIGYAIQYGKIEKDVEKSKKSSEFVVKHWISLMSQYWFIYILVAACFLIFKSDVLINKFSDSRWFVIFDFLAISDFVHTPTILGAFWYITFTQILTIMFPVLYKLCKEYGWNSIPISFILVYILPNLLISDIGGNYFNYIFTIIIGILFVQKDMYQKIQDKLEGKNKISILVILVLIIVSLFVLKSKLDVYKDYKFGMLCYAAIAVLFSIIGKECLHYKTFNWLRTLGAYSGDMYLIHLFIRNYLTVIFSVKSVFVTYVIFVIVSFVVSYLIGQIKRIICYNVLVKKVKESIVLN